MENYGGSRGLQALNEGEFIAPLGSGLCFSLVFRANTTVVLKACLNYVLLILSQRNATLPPTHSAKNAEWMGHSVSKLLGRINKAAPESRKGLNGQRLRARHRVDCGLSQRGGNGFGGNCGGAQVVGQRLAFLSKALAHKAQEGGFFRSEEHTS